MKPSVSSWSDFSAFFALALVVCLLLQTGCATVFRGRAQTILVTSDPPGAKVFVNGKQMSRTPVDIRVIRKNSHIVRLEKEGYAPYEIRMKRGLSGWLWANVPFITLMALPAGQAATNAAEEREFILKVAIVYSTLLLGVDFLTGAAFKQRPSKIEVKLSELGDTGVTP